MEGRIDSWGGRSWRSCEKSTDRMDKMWFGVCVHSAWQSLPADYTQLRGSCCSIYSLKAISEVPPFAMQPGFQMHTARSCPGGTNNAR